MKKLSVQDLIRLLQKARDVRSAELEGKAETAFNIYNDLLVDAESFGLDLQALDEIVNVL
jgi:hypothetical protein